MKIDRGLEEEHMTLTGTQDQDSVFKALTIRSSHFIDDMADVEYRVEEFVLFEPSFQIDTGAEFLSVIDTFPPAGIQYFFALKDHLGSNRIIFMDEDDDGTIDTTEIADESHYYPFGMDFYGDFYEKSSTFKYQYNAKELYTELDLGYYGYGTRFYDAEIGRFMGVDPISDQFQHVSIYNYAFNNPIRFIDSDGRVPDDIILRGANNSSVTIKTDLIDIDLDASSFVGDLGGNYTLEGADIVDAALDIGGLVDPTGAVDATAAVYHESEGNYGSAVISGISVLPFGDVDKVLKAGKHVKTIKNAVEMVSSGRKQVTKVFPTRKAALDAIPKPKPAQKGEKQVTRQSRNKSGEGKKFKTDGGSQTPHVHDRNHSDKTKPNVHYRVGTKKIKPKYGRIKNILDSNRI